MMFPVFGAEREQVTVAISMTCSGTSAPTLVTTGVPVTLTRTGTGTYKVQLNGPLSVKKLKTSIVDATTATGTYDAPIAERAYSTGAFTFKTFTSGSAANLTGAVNLLLVLGN